MNNRDVAAIFDEIADLLECPDEAVEVVPVGLDIAGFERCAVTVETSATGKRQGPIVMQSRIAPPVP